MTSDRARSYLWGGWAFASDVHLPRLHAVERPPELFIRWPQTPAIGPPPATDHRIVRRRDGGATRFAIGGDEGAFRYEISEVATYVIRALDGLVEVYPDPSADPMRVEHHLVNGVLATMAGLRREICLHAASIVDDGRAVLVGGPSGAGKSTFAWQKIHTGSRMLSDDYTVLRRSEGRWWAFPGPRTLRLVDLDVPGSWDNVGKSEAFVETETTEAPVTEFILVGAEGHRSQAIVEHSVLRLQTGWEWVGPEARSEIHRSLAAFCNDVPVRALREALGG